MIPKTMMNVVEMTWDDIVVHGEGTEIGVVMIVLHKGSDDELVTQVGANVAPDVVKYTMRQLVADWESTGGDFHVFPPRERKKAV